MKQVANCQQCSRQFSYYPTERRGLYCSQKCKNDFMWHNTTKPSIEAGTTSGFSIESFRRFLTERDGYQCSACPITDSWNGKPITLQVDHIDGNHSNNRGDNLRYLCPNCHSQEPTSYKNKRFKPVA